MQSATVTLNVIRMALPPNTAPVSPICRPKRDVKMHSIEPAGVQQASADTRRMLQRRALNAEGEIDDAVVVDVDLPVVVEVAVEPAVGIQIHVEIDPAVIIDVDLPIEICVGGPGVFDDDG